MLPIDDNTKVYVPGSHLAVTIYKYFSDPEGFGTYMLV